MKRFFQAVRHIVWMTCNLLAVFCLLSADLCAWLDPSKFTFCAIMGLGFEWLALLNVVFALSWLLTHRKGWALLSVVALLFSLHPLSCTISHNKPQNDLSAPKALSVLTYNTHMMGMVKKAGKNEVLKYVKESGADVVCLQEYEVRKDPYYLTFNEAKNYLQNQYPYTYYDFAHYNGKRQYGVAVYSRYPLINKQTIHYETRANISNRCDIVMGHDTIRLFNNHLESNRFDGDDLALTEDEMTSDGLKKTMRQLVKKMRQAYTFRAPEVREVRKEIEQSPYPVLVVGDMNDGPVSFTYHTLSKGLQDAYLQGSRCRLGHTYKLRFGGVRIDYILADKRFHVEWCDTENVDYSDHLPLAATFTW